MYALQSSFFSSFFFFSSRRRHTRCSRDWSSDVCSSDLRPGRLVESRDGLERRRRVYRERMRSEEHTSELQSRLHLVCRLLLEKKKNRDQTRLRFENLAQAARNTTPLCTRPWPRYYRNLP